MTTPIDKALEPTRVPILSFIKDHTRKGQTRKGLRYSQDAADLISQVKQHMDKDTCALFEARLDGILDMASRLKDKNGQLPRVLYVYLINPRRFKEAAYELKEDAIVTSTSVRLRHQFGTSGLDGDATPTPSTPIAANFGNSAPRHQAETFNELATSIYSQSEAEDNPSTSSSEPDIPGTPASRHSSVEALHIINSLHGRILRALNSRASSATLRAAQEDLGQLQDILSPVTQHSNRSSVAVDIPTLAFETENDVLQAGLAAALSESGAADADNEDVVVGVEAAMSRARDSDEQSIASSESESIASEITEAQVSWWRRFIPIS